MESFGKEGENISEERVAIFIDGSNVYHALRDAFSRVDLNFADFARKLVGERKLTRVYYYNILQEPSLRPDDARGQQEFLESLRRYNYMELRLGKTKLLQGVPVEKGIDIMLATDLLHFAGINFFDTAILVSGDGDFAYAVQAVKNMGKHVEVAYFEKHTSKDLLDIADYAHLLDRQFLTGLWGGGRGKGGAGSGGGAGTTGQRRRRGGARRGHPQAEGQQAPAPQPAAPVNPQLPSRPF